MRIEGSFFIALISVFIGPARIPDFSEPVKVISVAPAQIF